MPSKQPDDIFDLGADMLGTTQNQKGTITAQLGDVVGEEVSSDDAELWGPLGLAARPAKAIAGKSACQAIAIKQGSNDVIIATRDIRGSGLYGTLREGEVCLYAAGPSNAGTGQVLLQDDGSTQTITIQVNGSTRIIVKSDGSIAISGGPVNIAGASDFAALASKVDQGFQAIATAFASATPGPTETGLVAVKAALSAPPASVAATQVKIS